MVDAFNVAKLIDQVNSLLPPGRALGLREQRSIKDSVSRDLMGEFARVEHAASRSRHAHLLHERAVLFMQQALNTTTEKELQACSFSTPCMR